MGSTVSPQAEQTRVPAGRQARGVYSLSLCLDGLLMPSTDRTRPTHTGPASAFLGSRSQMPSSSRNTGVMFHQIPVPLGPSHADG